MKTGAYRCMAVNEVEHWYYLARARAIETLIRRYVLRDSQHPEILDVGCGTGGTSARLAKLGKLTGIEPSPLAIELLRSRYPSLQVVQGTIEDLPELLPESRFDLVTVFGVLCHRGVNDPSVALEILAAKLHDEGWILWGDCVYPCLTRSHDEFVESKQRFYPGQMHGMLRAAGFEIIFSSHFLGWGFPFALGMAALHRLARATGMNRTDNDCESADDRFPPPFINYALSQLTYWEWFVGLWGLKAPLGVSRLVLARKTARAPAPAESTINCVNMRMAGIS